MVLWVGWSKSQCETELQLLQNKYLLKASPGYEADLFKSYVALQSIFHIT